mmetsp:Transcript_24361/g.96612  ORF Transcript_24361/g.96612 Transcript_24361/m.96612 type:complete len:244 (-) Transcript_24361:1003-1734(-)
MVLRRVPREVLFLLLARRRRTFKAHADVVAVASPRIFEGVFADRRRAVARARVLGAAARGDGALRVGVVDVVEAPRRGVRGRRVAHPRDELAARGVRIDAAPRVAREVGADEHVLGAELLGPGAPFDRTVDGEVRRAAEPIIFCRGQPDERQSGSQCRGRIGEEILVPRVVHRLPRQARVLERVDGPLARHAAREALPHGPHRRPELLHRVDVRVVVGGRARREDARAALKLGPHRVERVSRE